MQTRKCGTGGAAATAVGLGIGISNDQNLKL